MELILRNILAGATLLFLAFLLLGKKRDSRLNWAMFYSTLWVSWSLLLVNYLCVQWGFWTFDVSEKMIAEMPFDLYFAWTILWGTLMVFLTKGRYFLIAVLSLFWMDLLLMPYLDTYGILVLHDYWLAGEILLILLVYIPAHFWAKYSLDNTHRKRRCFFQFLTVAFLYNLAIPLATLSYFPQTNTLNTSYIPFVMQFGFIIVLPAIIAVIDLAEKGKGTPFPYDATEHLVTNGVYAYIRNPIQWALTLFFIPLAIYYQTPLLLVGMVVSVCYTIGISNPQEFPSMTERFGQTWTDYKKAVPAWRFLWKPHHIPKGTLYFKQNCGICSEMRAWFEKQNPINVDFEHAENYDARQLLQVTYKDVQGNEYSSVKAIAHGFEHINLVWASLGWFMRLPLISYLLQLIVNAMGLRDVKNEDTCVTRDEGTVDKR